MASQNKQANKQVQQRYTFNNIGWSLAAFIPLVIVWCLIRSQSDIALKYLGIVDAFMVVLFIASLASVMMGVLKANLRWKYLAVLVALIWVITLPFVILLLAGPPDNSVVHIPW